MPTTITIDCGDGEPVTRAVQSWHWDQQSGRVEVQLAPDLNGAGPEVRGGRALADCLLDPTVGIVLQRIGRG